MRSDYAYKQTFEHILACMCRENRLAIETSLVTGLRISDVLSLRTSDLRSRDTFSIRELKTGKKRFFSLPKRLLVELLKLAGKVFIFNHRIDWRKHRTRQAVYKDIVRACRAFRLPKKIHITPHSARKFFAVSDYQKHQDLRRVKKLLNHDDEAVTLIYAMADQITARRLGNSLASFRGGVSETERKPWSGIQGAL